MDPAETTKRLAAWLVRREVKSSRTHAGVPLWSLVMDILSLGCTSANEWCVAHGLDPNMRVRNLR